MKTREKVTCEQYRELFENASDWIYTIDIDGQIVAFNNSVVKALKCNSARMYLNPIFQIG